MKTILCYGDSLTWGYSAEGPSRHALDDRWPSVLQAELGEGVQVIAEGLNGRTTAFDDHLAGEDRNGARVLPIAARHPFAARPRHHPARLERHEAVDSRQPARRAAWHAAAGTDRSRTSLPPCRFDSANPARIAAHGDPHGQHRVLGHVRRRQRSLAKACGPVCRCRRCRKAAISSTLVRWRSQRRSTARISTPKTPARLARRSRRWRVRY